MGKTQALIKDTFDEYFDRLKEMADLVERLQQIVRNVDEPNLKAQIKQTIDELECEIKIYAKELKVGGKELMRVA